MGITIGIDLGTTNSVTCVKKINVSPILNAEGEELTPSCVTAVPHANQAGFDFIVGRASRDLLKQYPEQTITSVKRLMGRNFEESEVQNMIANHAVSYQITTDPTEPHSIKIPLGAGMQTPEMISGIILQKLIQDGEKELQGKIDQAVVTVPAYFSDRQKFATRAACDYAGIKLLRLLPEPTAAALSFGLTELNSDQSQTIMVFDLGGGTFDLSILSLAAGNFMEVTKGGDMWLGGDNIDQLLIQHIYSQAQQTLNCPPILELISNLNAKDKARFLVEIKEKAERCKIELSSEDAANIEIFGILKDKDNQLIDIDITVTRAEFDHLIQPIVNRVTTIATQILHEIRFEPELIDSVLMVGGSSLIPAIQDEIRAIFGSEKVHVHPRPMLAVAEGAALMAAKMISQDTEEASFNMMHATAHDYYLQLAGGGRHLLVARNTPLPVTVEEKLSFAHEDQYLARLRIFNEVEGILETVGELWFHREDAEISSQQHDAKPEIMLRFSVDEDNIITMKTWSLQNTTHCIEAQIARGGLAAKLYNDLESILSTIVAQCDNGRVEEDCLLLSRKVVSSILSASDPITGETRIEQKQKAEKQIATLKGLQTNSVAAKGLYDFALVAQKAASPVLKEHERKQLDDIINRLASSLDGLDNIDSFVGLKTELQAFYHDFPTAHSLTRADVISKGLEDHHPEDAKRIRRLAKNIIDMHATEDQEKVEDARDDLDNFITSRFTYKNNMPSRRFDRDVSI